MSVFVVSSVLIILFVVLLIIGMPIAISIGFSSLIAIFLVVDPILAVSITAKRFFSGIDSFSILAMPFFILAGNIMNEGNIAIRFINVAKLIGGRLPGALAHTNVIANMLFGSVSGSSVAAAAAIGGIMGPIEEKDGYNKNFSAAVNIASAPSGLLIPPSGSVIVYALVSGGTSVSALFMAGYIPGILLGISIMVVAYFFAKKNNYPVFAHVSTKQKIKIIFQAIPSLMLIVIVIGGIVGGIFTATEGSAIAVVYSLLLSIVYKSMTIKKFIKIIYKSACTSSIILFLISASSVMSWLMSYTNIPELISTSLLSLSSNKYVLLFLISVILLFVGTFMDITPAILIFTPIFLPIATQLGIHPVHFGIMFIFNMCIGNTTPPVGSVLFVGCNISNTKIEHVSRMLIPFFIAMILCLLLVVYIPWISMIVPSSMGMISS